jgi:hypothetical protein
LLFPLKALSRTYYQARALRTLAANRGVYGYVRKTRIHDESRLQELVIDTHDNPLHPSTTSLVI